MNVSLKTSLIAPCGMNCGLCRAYQRTKNRCAGCNAADQFKLAACIQCKMKNCEELQKSRTRFCSGCKDYPCLKIRHIDKRYKHRYGMSMTENLASIKKIGLRKFTSLEKVKWSCPQCTNLICVHDKICPSCGAERILKKYQSN